MAQVSTVQFNGSNAYELLVGEFVSSWPMGAVGLENISVGVQVYSATTGAGVKLTLRSFDSAGEVLSSQDYSYTVTNTSMWERAEKTWACPTGIDRVELRITALVGTVLFAQPKMANGETVGAYSTNYAPQLTLLTPTGIYTGTLTANQVIVSGGEDLASKLVTINANQISMTSDIDGVDSRTTVLEAGTVKLGTEYNGVTIDQSTGFKSVATIEGKLLEVKINATDGLIFKYDGVIIGGVAVADGEASTLSSTLINPADRKIEWKVGSTGTGGGALTGYDTDAQNEKYKFITIDGISTVATVISVPTDISIFQLTHGVTQLQMRSGSNAIGLLNSVGGVNVLNTESKMWSGVNQLGVDSTGVYKSIAGVKTYL